MHKKDLMLKSKSYTSVEQDYRKLLDEIKSIFQKAKYQAYKAIDNLKVQTYWQVGDRIVRDELRYKERADYGEKIIERLATDLNITRALLFEIVQFYKIYPIVHTLRGQLSWSHYGLLIRIKENEKREFYEIQTLQNLWSIRELEKQIKSGLYERMIKKSNVILNKSVISVMPEKIFKDTYNFDFLQIGNNYNEKNVEDGLIRNVELLLLEFGQDFSLAGRQRKIVIDGQIHYIDLEFYHRGLCCIVLADIKIGQFKSEYVGQMNKYLNYYKEKRKYSWEKNPIGLIICEYKGDEEVRYALGGLEDKIFVAEYKKKLPTEKEIRERLKKIKGITQKN